MLCCTTPQRLPWCSATLHYFMLPYWCSYEDSCRNSANPAQLILIFQVNHPKLVGLEAQNHMKDGTLWVPQLEPMNALSDVSVHNDTYFVNGTECMRWQRLKFTCKARFVLHAFPFDVQLLPVRFESSRYDESELLLHLDNIQKGRVSPTVREMHMYTGNTE